MGEKNLPIIDWNLHRLSVILIPVPGLALYFLCRDIDLISHLGLYFLWPAPLRLFFTGR
jgi:hypothetical protein